MTITSKATLKTFFQTGDTPSQSQFGDLMDSFIGLGETASQTIPSAIVVSGAVSLYSTVTLGATALTSWRTALGLGTAALLDVGTGASQVVQLTAASKLPAVDGSLLTNIVLPSQTAESVLVNATGSAAKPSALVMAASTVLGRDTTGNISALTLSGLTAVSGVLTNSSPFTVSFQSNAITMSAGTGGTVAHGLGGRPKLIYGYIRCVSADIGYAVGDEVPMPAEFNNFGANAWSSGTANIGYWIATNFRLPNASTGGDIAISYSAWEYRIRAYA